MLLFLLFPPLLSLLVFLYKIKCQGSASFKEFYFLWFLVTLIGIYWYPWGDTQTHFSIYYSKFSELYMEPTVSSTHWLYDYTIALIANYAKEFQYAFWAWLIVPFFVLFYAIKINVPPQYRLPWLIVFYFVMAIGIRELLDLCRTTSAAIFLISAILFFKQKRYLPTVILIFVASLLHDTARLLVTLLPLCVFIHKIPSKFVKYGYPVLAFASALLISTLGQFFLSERNMEMYMSKEGLLSDGVGSGLMHLLAYINVIVFLFNFYLIQLNKKVIDRYFYSVHLLLSLMVFVVFFHWIGRERMMMYYNLYAIVVILLYNNRFIKNFLFLRIHYLNILISVFVLRLFVVLTLTYAGHYLYGTATRDSSKELDIVSRILYMPSIMCFDIYDYGFNDNAYNSLYKRVIDTNE